jgi:hypothetical protein
MAPHTPQRSERPGEAEALLDAPARPGLAGYFALESFWTNFAATVFWLPR